MKRRTFDTIVTTVGFGLSLFLLIAAGLLNWGHDFAVNTVKSQLIAQQITMPAETNNADETSDVTAFFKANGDQLMTTGKQAQMYSDNYLGFHLSKMPPYAQASSASRAAQGALAANPTDPILLEKAKATGSTLETVFRGTMLQGMLLNAYAWGFMGSIAGIGSLVALIAGLLLLILSIFGVAHKVKTPHEANI